MDVNGSPTKGQVKQASGQVQIYDMISISIGQVKYRRGEDLSSIVPKFMTYYQLVKGK